MPKSSRGIGQTPPNASLISGSEAVCLEHTGFPIRESDTAYTLTGEATQGRKTVRGWVSGNTKNQISVSDFDWKRLGQFVVSKVRLLERNSGLLLRRKEVKEGEFLPRLKPWVSSA